MAFTNFLILFFLLAMVLSDSSTAAAHHQIRDAVDWTAAGTIDYAEWASSNLFQIGDELDFKYDHQFHDVMEVSSQDFESCNSTSPILTYTTGHDSVKLTSGGHHYYLCGIPGHCVAGQKVDIFVRGQSNSCGPNINPPHHYNHASSAPFLSFQPWRSAKLLDMFLLVAYAIFA